MAEIKLAQLPWGRGRALSVKCINNVLKPAFEDRIVLPSGEIDSLACPYLSGNSPLLLE